MKHLTSEQRYTIERMLGNGYSQRKIAEIIGVDESTVSKELKRNKDMRSGEYRAKLAHSKSEERKKEKPKPQRFTESIRMYVEEGLANKLSPEQIAGKASKENVPCVSTERIYQMIWENKKQGGELYKHLRTRGKRYRGRGDKKDSRGIIKGRRSIDERPEEVELKERIGDLEIDTIIGKDRKGAILTINDRVTGKVKIRKLTGKNAQQLADATVDALSEWKPFLKTITSDNGKEFACHQFIAEQLNIDFYFAHPYHSWERGRHGMGQMRISMGL
jgi:IS30 family transposase